MHSALDVLIHNSLAKLKGKSVKTASEISVGLMVGHCHLLLKTPREDEITSIKYFREVMNKYF